MTYTFIVNPHAGRGRFRAAGNPLEAAARMHGLDSRFLYTERRGHATALAASAAAGSDIVVAVGGDGTIHEVVSGLLRGGAQAHLGVVSSGTGNDFAGMFDLPRRLDALLHVFRTTEPRRVDYGRIRWEGPAADGSGVFVNVAGAGFDAKVAAAAAGFKIPCGAVRYLLAVFRTLPAWESPRAAVNFYRSGTRVGGLEEDVLLALAGNGRRAAGGLYLTPDASVVDGLLDVCAVRHAGMGRILSLLPHVLRGGGHENAREVAMARVDALEIRSKRPVPVQADGEVLTEGATYVRFEAVAGGLPVVMPVKM